MANVITYEHARLKHGFLKRKQALITEARLSEIATSQNVPRPILTHTLHKP